MTASVTELTVTAEDRRVAWLATAAVALSLVDAAIPSPLPGVKPGLANIVTLVVLQRYGWATAVWVSGLRVLAGSLSITFFFYVFVNSAMVTGLIPVVGVPLPLVSAGGTSMVTLLTGFGILMSIHTHRRLGDAVRR